MIKLIRLAVIGAAAAVTLQLTGCAATNMGVPTPTVENVSKLRAAQAAPAAVGTFKVDGRVEDKSVGIRASSLQAPSGSFAQHLGETLKAELTAAGLLDPNSTTVITGTLNESTLDPAMGTAKGSLAARFVVTRAGQVRYDADVRVDASWESSFMGAVAIPLAAQQYEGLYRQLIGKLFDDAKFKQALAK